MAHKNYFEIRAQSYYDLGLQEGRLFGRHLRDSIKEKEKEFRRYKKQLAAFEPYISITAEAFPHLAEELVGYARGAGVELIDFWLLLLEDEVVSNKHKCTTLVTNGGSLIAHNEDWSADAKNDICILKKTVDNVTILELFYLSTLGGNAASVNSHGFTHTVNSLSHKDNQLGVSRNVIARWLSETRSAESDYRTLLRIRRASGYNHNLVGPDGTIWNIECSAQKQVLTFPKSPFVHTNHFLTELFAVEATDNSDGTIQRYDCARSQAKNPMPVDSVINLLSDSSGGRKTGVFNETTIARTIVDIGHRHAYIWLLREKKRGWIKYDLDFLG
jgi:predicted choloylglycine hydrolase